MDQTQFSEWIGRKSESEDVVTPRLAASYRAIFGDRLAPVGEGDVPLGIHWCLSPAIAPMEALGPDGHPAKNRDLPPIPQPRRMWAGGQLETLAPIRFKAKRLADVSGGAGAHRGGMGQVVAFESCWPGRLRVSLLTDRTRVPAKGILGGEAGRPGHVWCNGKPVENPKGVVDLMEGDTLELALPGGGGYGKPL